MRISVIRRALALAMLAVAPALHAAHPLITEDTGTQGRGNSQLELTIERSHDEAEGIHRHATQANAVLGHGVRDDLDLLLTLPYKRQRTEEDGAVTEHAGGGDVGLDAKWRFLEREGFSMALKPGVTAPTGDDARGLGTGRTAWSLFLVSSFERRPWALHVHAGHIHNRNRVGERVHRWHVSVAGWREVGPLKWVADLGTNTNSAASADSDPAYFIVGVIYSVRKRLDLDLGYKKGIRRAETDRTWLGGVTFRF